eukprot:273088-Amphidinium_carterae.1
MISEIPFVLLRVCALVFSVSAGSYCSATCSASSQLPASAPLRSLFVAVVHNVGRWNPAGSVLQVATWGLAIHKQIEAQAWARRGATHRYVSKHTGTPRNSPRVPDFSAVVTESEVND